MKINKKVQYGILLVMYIVRSGKTTIDTISQNLGISKQFLHQISVKLRKSGIIRSIRGANGGYELAKMPTIREIYNSLDSVELVPIAQIEHYYYHGSTEMRAFAEYIRAINVLLKLGIDQTVKQVLDDLTKEELVLMEKAEIHV